jgi:hypothetical protein
MSLWIKALGPPRAPVVEDSFGRGLAEAAIRPPVEVCAVEDGATEVCSLHPGTFEESSTEIGARQARSTQIAVAQPRPRQIGIGQVRFAQIYKHCIRPNEPSAAEHGMLQISQTKIGSGHVRSCQIRTG